MTKVINLATEEVCVFPLPPREAVIAAWEQERGNFNTWTYVNSKAPVIVGSKTVSADNWAAMLEKAAAEAVDVFGEDELERSAYELAHPELMFGLCPVCGARISCSEDNRCKYGRLIGSCDDAFTDEQWAEPDYDPDAPYYPGEEISR